MSISKKLGTDISTEESSKSPLSTCGSNNNPIDKQATSNSSQLSADTTSKNDVHNQNKSPGDDCPPNENNHDDFKMLFEMIGDLTEQTKSITIKTDLIPELQANFQSMRSEISSFKDNVTAQVAELSCRVLANEEDIVKLQQHNDANKVFMASHVRPAIKKLEKGGIIDLLSTQLLEKISSNENAITELRQLIESTDTDKTFNFCLSDEEITTVALHVQNLADEGSPLAAVKSAVAKSENSIAALLKADKVVADRMQLLEKQVSDLVSAKPGLNISGNKGNNNNNNDNKDRNRNNNVNFKPPAEHQTLDL